MISSERRATLKEWVEVCQGVFTIGAIVAAGIWFIEQQSLKPQIKLEQTISQRAEAGKPGFWLVAVDVRATNLGKVKVALHGGRVWLKQINPVPGEDLIDVPLKDLELDPGEGDQAIFKTFELPDYVHTLQVTSNYGVPNDKAYYWQLESASEIGDAKPDKTTTSSPK
jgi:hypothetical protein